MQKQQQKEDDGLDKILAMVQSAPEYEEQRATLTKKVNSRHYKRFAAPCDSNRSQCFFFFFLRFFFAFLGSRGPRCHPRVTVEVKEVVAVEMVATVQTALC